MKRKNKKTKRYSLAYELKKSIKIVAIITGFVLFLTLMSMILSEFFGFPDIFSTNLFSSGEMNIPFAILVEILTSTAGIYIGLQIDKFVDKQKEYENRGKVLAILWHFTNDIKTQIANNRPLSEIAQNKLHLDTLLQSDYSAVKFLQQKPYYKKLIFVFGFLEFNRPVWSVQNISNLNLNYVRRSTNFNDDFKNSCNEWEIEVDALSKLLDEDLKSLCEKFPTIKDILQEKEQI